ncbi:ankyrin repeat-containing protein [Colletotrichum kahawae]|uniref:Ankyrin repeat-containing protein n=1 Tax=Colletotrichum kahawae TaxID=34407 RepID=A0AAE0CYT2_COLKA|nr:ankyrin repeat-containing protein [Colletotrichum kahawae]
MYLALPVWTELSYSYIADIRSAHNTQKQYLREISAPTEVLLRSEEVSQNLKKENLGFSRPDDLSKSVVTECAQKLDKLCTELRKPSPSIFWPIQEKNLKKHIEDLHRFRSSEGYTQWAAGSKLPLLWCYALVRALHYFFDFGNRKEQTKEAVWKDLLRQVVARGGPSTVQKLVNFRKELGIHRPASSKDFSDGLKIACADQQFVLVLEGSDGMETPGELKTILVPFTNASVLIISRDTPEIRSTLNQATVMEVQADANDMRAYVASRFEDCDLDDPVERPPELEKEILEKSQGIWSARKGGDLEIH